MYKNKIVKRSIFLILSTLFLGCVTNNGSVTNYPTVNSLAQERLFLRDKPFVKNDVMPTIPFPPKSKSFSAMGLASTLFEVIAPDLIEGTVDLVGQSIVELSGKNDETTTIHANLSNFFYKDAIYNLTSPDSPVYHLLFISGEFGEKVEHWTPKGLDSTQAEVFKTLNLVGKPNFYMEAKIFPVPGNQYMEVAPTYIFYNRAFNTKGLDSKRDLEIHFSFYALGSQSENNLLSDGSVVLRDVQVGKEYTQKELADVRTSFLKMPKIAESKKGYSGGYNLKVSVTETRDINEWLASIGETISGSKTNISSKLYLSKEEKIERDTSLAKAKIEVQIMEAKIEEARIRGDSTAELLELKSKLLDKKATANKKAVEFGKSKLY